MLLRRVMRHVKAQNWFAVCVDFFIVVVGAFVGLQERIVKALRMWTHYV